MLSHRMRFAEGLRSDRFCRMLWNDFSIACSDWESYRVLHLPHSEWWNLGSGARVCKHPLVPHAFFQSDSQYMYVSIPLNFSLMRVLFVFKDYFPNYNISFEPNNAWQQYVASLYAREGVLQGPQLETFAKGGFYAASPRPGLKLGQLTWHGHVASCYHNQMFFDSDRNCFWQVGFFQLVDLIPFVWVTKDL